MTVDLTTPTFETISETRLPFKDGKEIVVALRRSPNGHAAVDVREHVLASDAPVIVGKGKSRRVRSDFTGPTRCGFWMPNPSTLLDLADAIARYALELETLQTTD